MSSSQNQNIWIAIKHRQKFVCKYRKEIESILEHRFFFCVYRSSISDFFTPIILVVIEALTKIYNIII